MITGRSRRTTPEPGRRPAEEAAVGIYMGKGASHSWTWLADSLEREGYTGLAFLDEEDVQDSRLHGLDALAIGGGDPVAMAEGLKPAGARALHGFVRRGGVYLGFCAGCYLGLCMDEEPCMGPFRLTEASAANVVVDLPPITTLPTKASTHYGGKHVLHPVRERVLLAWPDAPGGAKVLLEAPLYGGPPIAVTEGEIILGRYHAFTRETQFLVDRALAAEMLLNKVAACSRRVGRGEVFLFGPHLENPAYPAANRVFATLLSRSLRRRSALGTISPTGDLDETCLIELRGFLGDLRIAALALEFADAVWWIGRKAYEPAKIPVFADAMWRRMSSAMRLPRFADPVVIQPLANELAEVAEIVRRIGRDLRRGEDTQDLAEKLFPRLRGVTARFLNHYFASLRSACCGPTRAGYHSLPVARSGRGARLPGGVTA